MHFSQNFTGYNRKEKEWKRKKETEKEKVSGDYIKEKKSNGAKKEKLF